MVFNYSLVYITYKSKHRLIPKLDTTKDLTTSHNYNNKTKTLSIITL